jgi:membrane-associated phospholipid phosphatase
MHVVLCVGVVLSVYGTGTIGSKLIKAAILVLNILIILSTMLIKQHSVLDIIVGIPWGAAVYGLVYLFTQRKKTA